MLINRGSPIGPVNVARGVPCKIVEVLSGFRIVRGVLTRASTVEPGPQSSSIDFITQFYLSPFLQLDIVDHVDVVQVAGEFRARACQGSRCAPFPLSPGNYMVGGQEAALYFHHWLSPWRAVERHNAFNYADLTPIRIHSMASVLSCPEFVFFP